MTLFVPTGNSFFQFSISFPFRGAKISVIFFPKEKKKKEFKGRLSGHNSDHLLDRKQTFFKGRGPRKENSVSCSPPD